MEINEEKKKWVSDRQERRREMSKTDGVVNCLDGQDNWLAGNCLLTIFFKNLVISPYIYNGINFHPFKGD